MKRDNVAFLIGGLFYGALIGFGVSYFVEHRPRSETGSTAASVPAPAGPMAPTQVGTSAAGSGAPMRQEIEALKGRLAEDPRDAVTLTRLANLYHDAGMWPQAVSYYERAVEVIPRDPNLMTDLGVCYQNLAEFDRALEMFAKAQEVDPNHWQSLYNIVIVAGMNLGQLDRADAALKRLVEVQPSAPNIDRLRQTLEHVREARDSGGES